jgi:hypothetical protein
VRSMCQQEHMSVCDGTTATAHDRQASQDLHSTQSMALGGSIVHRSEASHTERLAQRWRWH